MNGRYITNFEAAQILNGMKEGNTNSDTHKLQDFENACNYAEKFALFFIASAAGVILTLPTASAVPIIRSIVFRSKKIRKIALCKAGTIKHNPKNITRNNKQWKMFFVRKRLRIWSSFVLPLLKPRCTSQTPATIIIAIPEVENTKAKDKTVAQIQRKRFMFGAKSSKNRWGVI